jgi:hypothetical protein
VLNGCHGGVGTSQGHELQLHGPDVENQFLGYFFFSRHIAWFSFWREIEATGGFAAPSPIVFKAWILPCAPPACLRLPGAPQSVLV